MAVPQSTNGESRNAPVGIAMLLCAVLFFACMDVITKYLTQTYSVPLVLAMRYALSAALMLIFLLPRYGRQMFIWHRPWVVLMRAVVMSIASLLASYALKFLPVAETVAIIYLAPFGVLFLAGPVLGEKVKLSSWIVAMGGFLGLLLIVRPGGGLASNGVIFALAGAFAATWYFLLTRLLATTESTIALLFAVNMTGTVIFGATLPWTFSGPTPAWGDLWLFGLAGSVALIGHFLMTAAYREATAAVLAPLNYAHLVWAGLLGWLIFDHVPDALAILGITVIALSGGALALWNQISGRRKLRPPVS